MKIIFDENIIKYISLVESLTGASVKDCIMNSKLIFIIKETDIGKAIGKKGSNIKKMEHILHKKIKMVEFSSDVLQFIKNFIYPIEVVEIKKDSSNIIIKGNNVKTKGLLIGRNKANLNLLTNVTKRYFEINEIKVI